MRGGHMERKEPKFPKGFFTQPRPTISNKEALKEIIPFEWSKDVKKGKKEAILCLSKKNEKKS